MGVHKDLPLAPVSLTLQQPAPGLGALHSTTTLDFSSIYLFIKRGWRILFFFFQSIWQATVEQPNLEFGRIASSKRPIGLYN
jgi:hypothetical protein